VGKGDTFVYKDEITMGGDSRDGRTISGGDSTIGNKFN
jgi:hypothetical protein